MGAVKYFTTVLQHDMSAAGHLRSLFLSGPCGAGMRGLCSVCVCVITVRGTFSLSSRLIARASCSCSSSSPLVVGRACSKSGATRGEEEEAAGTEEEQRGLGV